MSDDVHPGVYRHFKGGRYEVVLLAQDTETEEPVVVYQALYGERGHWVRSLADFTAHVTRGDYDGPRFVRVPTAEVFERERPNAAARLHDRPVSATWD